MDKRNCFLNYLRVEKVNKNVNLSPYDKLNGK